MSDPAPQTDPTLRPRSSRALLILGGLFGLLLLLAASVYVGLRLRGDGAAPSSIGGAFSLTRQDGSAFSDRSLLGKPSLLFFGFTHCPDVCPTALFEMTQILNELGADAAKVNVVFTSVDPERDTPQQLKLYLSSFHPAIIGLSGNEAATGDIMKAYRVYARKVPLESGGYTMDHTALVYLLNKQGQFVRPFDIKSDPKDAAARLRPYL